MGYRLKDKELQKRLDEISDGDFSKQLLLSIEALKKSDLGFCLDDDRVFVDFGSPIRAFMMPTKFRVCIEPGEILFVTDYCDEQNDVWQDIGEGN